MRQTPKFALLPTLECAMKKLDVKLLLAILAVIVLSLPIGSFLTLLLLGWFLS